MEDVEVFKRRNGGSDFRLLITPFFQAARFDDRLARSRSFLLSSRSAWAQHSGGCERMCRKASLLGWGGTVPKANAQAKKRREIACLIIATWDGGDVQVRLSR